MTRLHDDQTDQTSSRPAPGTLDRRRLFVSGALVAAGAGALAEGTARAAGPAVLSNASLWENRPIAWDPEAMKVESAAKAPVNMAAKSRS